MAAPSRKFGLLWILLMSLQLLCLGQPITFRVFYTFQILRTKINLPFHISDGPYYCRFSLDVNIAYCCKLYWIFVSHLVLVDRLQTKSDLTQNSVETHFEKFLRSTKKTSLSGVAFTISIGTQTSQLC